MPRCRLCNADRSARMARSHLLPSRWASRNPRAGAGRSFRSGPVRTIRPEVPPRSSWTSPPSRHPARGPDARSPVPSRPQGWPLPPTAPRVFPLGPLGHAAAPESEPAPVAMYPRGGSPPVRQFRSVDRPLARDENAGETQGIRRPGPCRLQICAYVHGGRGRFAVSTRTGGREREEAPWQMIGPGV